MGGPLPAANPRPAYLGQEAAQQLASTELDRPVDVSDNALDLVNSFIDQLLYNILSLSKSTALEQLRKAVPKLLKPRLGHAAITAADEELRDYVSKDDDVETSHTSSRPAKPGDFDIELAWKLARLRCMVYARLGDMEEEDEEEYLDSERLAEHFQGSPMSVAPMSAIFLTSILEFLGEQALCNAAQHAERRHDTQLSKKAAEDGEVSEADDTVLVDVADMLQLGREGPLSRLWRSWRRDSRASESFTSRPTTPGYAIAGESSHSRGPSHTSRAAAIPEEATPDASPRPADIPLPMGERDIDEIEVPGLANDFEETTPTASQRPSAGPKRPSSLLIVPGNFPPSPGPGSPSSPTIPQRSSLRPSYVRQRSQSLPGPGIRVFNTPASHVADHPSAEDEAEASAHEPAIIDDSIEEQKARDVASSTASAQVSRPTTQQSSRGSVVNGAALAAIAGALGIEAARSSRKSKDAHTSSRPETPRNRTVAEELMGPSNNVAAPQDAETHSSITGPGDFESMHVPTSADRDISDPEDLALSSADEENASAAQTRHREPRDSGFAVAGPSHASPHTSPQAASTPSSPRRNREAAVYENSIMSSPREQVTDFDDDSDARPRTRESVTFEPSALASVAHHDDTTDESADLPLQRPDSIASQPQQGATDRAINNASIIPPRVSSREQYHSGHKATMSHSSQYSHDSKRSSSSSKLLGFSRDQDGKPVKEPRGNYADQGRSSHSRVGSNQTASRVIPGAALGAGTAGALAARREHLRVRTDSEEDAARSRSLEVLIKSDETLHYTLTPESARAEEVSLILIAATECHILTHHSSQNRLLSLRLRHRIWLISSALQVLQVLPVLFGQAVIKPTSSLSMACGRIP
jgi:hypothetical protein